MEVKGKIRVAVMFGGRSTEHEISIITALQAIENLDKERYEVLPVYIAKDGRWYANDKRLLNIETFKNLNTISSPRAFVSPDSQLKGIIDNPQETRGLFKKIGLNTVDVALLCFHGSYGEDGAVQGLLEMANIPYTGCGVASSSLCMDKVLAKSVLKDHGVKTVPGVWFLRDKWEEDEKEIIKNLESELGYPMFVKPVNSGSSIGVKGAKNREELKEAIEVAKFYDRRILVEKAINDPKEVNISVIGYKNIELSEIEMPVASTETLSYEDKYMKGGKSQGMASLSRIIPAPVKEATKKKIEEYANAAFLALDCSGVIRIDFIMTQDEKEIYLNEVNTIPGSLSFYLWQPKGISYKEHLDKLLDIAFERHQDRANIIRTFATNVLEGVGGLKGKA